jgi:hypothetical protein
MAGPISAFNYMSSPYQAFLSLQSAASSIKGSITNTSSYLWEATTSKTKNTIDTSFQMLTTTRDSVSAKIQNTKNSYCNLKIKYKLLTKPDSRSLSDAQPLPHWFSAIIDPIKPFSPSHHI